MSDFSYVFLFAALVLILNTFSSMYKTWYLSKTQSENQKYLNEIRRNSQALKQETSTENRSGVYVVLFESIKTPEHLFPVGSPGIFLSYKVAQEFAEDFIIKYSDMYDNWYITKTPIAGSCFRKNTNPKDPCVPPEPSQNLF